MEIERISRLRFASTILWAIVGSTVVVASAAGLARATLNLNGALVEKPEIAVYLLMPEEHITHVEVLREGEDTKDLLLETKEGKMLVTMKKGEEEWFISYKEQLHE
ncbi:hypothetical protein HN512_03075 [Candidatus Peregrinibacteria bacterium]|jgi:hypothetical protein|nr:hypothetical protein [Candidatus Peregrinibacteria bacterium]MBT3598795.1 hypothetical protein [Candidatus Peregrinibacteria bacterium]MBT4367363.1 hypothetical protein [Candidatus Peregrinibacteria bacterium]MBT4585864.1 hypothetical protein [Candidatus Peregrinibacteria bacterium]MBT6731195.1 hypothetical protein [Candidatus Peregrinibacteria bacterium]